MLKPSSGVYDLDDMMDVGDGVADPNYVINIGISLEPMSSVEQAMAAQKQQTALPSNVPIPSIAESNASSNPMVVGQVATKIYENAYNFMGGFITPDGRVPMKAFEEWWNKFRTKIQNNPRYLEESS